jgi:hypothetical protein
MPQLTEARGGRRRNDTVRVRPELSHGETFAPRDAGRNQPEGRLGG